MYDADELLVRMYRKALHLTRTFAMRYRQHELMMLMIHSAIACDMFDDAYANMTKHWQVSVSLRMCMCNVQEHV
jgi:hypothetical protein